MFRLQKFIFGFVIFAFSFVNVSFSQTVPAGQTAGGVLQQREQIEKGQALEERIKTPRKKKDEVIKEEKEVEDTGEKVLIKKITIEGVTLLTEDELNKIKSEYEGKEMSITGMQSVADKITDIYRQKGYATSRAYIPPQSLKEGSLLIRVVEGRLGNLEIKGNKWFRTSLLEKKIKLDKGAVFDYDQLQKGMTYVNEHPDRTARAVLVPGKEPGTTDIVVNVEDNLPIHVGFEYDNYASKYLNEDRYSTVLEHNNLFGIDDKLNLRFQRSESYNLRVFSARYSVPINNTLEVGGYFFKTRTKLGGDFESLDSRGNARIGGIFLSKQLISETDLDIRANVAYDYKSIYNYLNGAEDSNDELRIAKVGIDIDKSDNWGRTILTAEVDQGIPRMFGGSTAKDSNASRIGAGGEFTKGYFNLFRLQPMPWSSYLLFKNTLQVTNHNLVASEQFQIGGPTSVRGYPAAEKYGDKGLYSAVEWSVKPTIIPQGWVVPFTKDVTWRDSLRLVAFYDWAEARIKNPQTGESKHNRLYGWGGGVRWNVRDSLSFRVEVGYPGGETPSDGKHAHPWVECIVKF